MDIDRLKEAYRIGAAWRDLGLPGEPAKTCRSPFGAEHKHGDANPSFSVFAEGTRWKDFSTGAGGDVIDFVAKALAADTATALKWIEQRLGIVRPERKPDPPKKGGPKLPHLRPGTTAELRELSERRGFAVEALRLAQSRGFLKFCNLWGQSAWCVADQRAQLHEFRRLDGRKWPAYGRLPERKSHCLGTGKAWPIGTLESLPFPKIAMLEGAPDVLAACHFILLEGKAQSVAPVGVLGASNHRLAPAALAHFKGKHVTIFPHVDDAGRKAAREWALALREAGAARVTAFDLSGLILGDGSTGKDLADLCRISADCLDREAKFREVMP